MCVLIYSTIFVCNTARSKKKWARLYIGLHVTYPLGLSDVNESWILDRFSKKRAQISNFLKIRPTETELFHADRQTDRHEEANSRFKQYGECA